MLPAQHGNIGEFLKVYIWTELPNSLEKLY